MANLKNTTIDGVCTTYNDFKIGGSSIENNGELVFYPGSTGTVKAFENCSTFLVNDNYLYQYGMELEFSTNTTSTTSDCLKFANNYGSSNNIDYHLLSYITTKFRKSSTQLWEASKIENRNNGTSGASGILLMTKKSSTTGLNYSATFAHDKIQFQIVNFEEDVVTDNIIVDSSGSPTRLSSYGQVMVYDSGTPFSATESYERGRLIIRQRGQGTSDGIHFILPTENIVYSSPSTTAILEDGSTLTYTPEYTNYGRNVYTGYSGWLMESYDGASGTRQTGALIFRKRTNNSSWSTEAWLNNTVSTTALNFTGQHRNCFKQNATEYNNSAGLIVVSCGEFANFDGKQIQINQALPVVKLSDRAKQETVFGVISSIENPGDRQFEFGPFVTVLDKKDERLIINSIGEGSIWVTNINGNLENGDFITTCEIPGYGMKQDIDILMNYTVAKITCDCDFSFDSEEYICEEFEYNGAMYRKAFVGCTYHCG